MASFADLLPETALVLRGGLVRALPPSEIVVGDIVHLAAGCGVPADLRLLACADLKVDKAMITGETGAIRLVAESVPDPNTVTLLQAPNMAFMGCNVLEGEGQGLVVATGKDNQLSKIAYSVAAVDGGSNNTTLQRDISRFVTIIATIATLTAIVVILEWTFYLRVEHNGFMTPSSMLANAISVLVAYVPEGLPLALSMGLTIIARRLCLTHFVLVKQLSIIETVGAMTMLASDKTGTLTTNKMTVKSLITADCIVDASFLSLPCPSSALVASPQYTEYVLQIAIMCNQAKFEGKVNQQGAAKSEIETNSEVSAEEGNHSKVHGGNGIDTALMIWASEFQKFDSIRSSIVRKAVLPFSSATKISAVVVQEFNAGNFTTTTVLVKGAPEYILSRCSNYISGTQSIQTLDNVVISRIKDMIEDVSRKGDRVIAFAQFILSPNDYPANYAFKTSPEPNFPVTGLTFVACVSVSDPPRRGVREAVLQMRGAGIMIAMVTGDAPTTAQAISCQVGIISDGSRIDVFSSKSLSRDSSDIEQGIELRNSSGISKDKNRAIVVEGTFLSDISEEGWDFIMTHSEMVFARTTPDQKLQIVTEFQKRGHLVGVTGDGVNDSPALKKADVGLAMNAGSTVAKDAAAIVLLKDDFRAIVKAVEEGRLIFANLRKVIAYQIAAGCWSELIPVLATFFLGMPQPLSSFLMIIISTMTDVYGGVALTREPPENLLMRENPRDIKKNPLVDFTLVGYSYLFYGTLQSLAAFVNYFLYMSQRGPLNTVQNPIPADDDGSTSFPVGYSGHQLVGAWNWGLNSGNLGTDQAGISLNNNCWSN
jgi:sodium/potassium-transporting ATPase subunit alpha